jgi:glycosyltransferase involved in cell wall biosynthesis
VSAAEGLRVVHVSYADTAGGAARGVYALHRGLLAVGIDSRLVVARKSSHDQTVYAPSSPAGRAAARLVPGLENAAVRFVADPCETFSVNAVGLPLLRLVGGLRPDVVNLHWIGGGLLRPAQVAALPAPVVWTLRDMHAFTGGCHYSHGCDSFTERCGRCPVLGSRRERDLSRWTHDRKRRAWEGRPMTLVALSRWLAGRARRSSLFRGVPVQVVNPGVDVERFRPADREATRRQLGLPTDADVVAFVAVDVDERRKGADALERALARLALARRPRPLVLAVAGAGTPPRAEPHVRTVALGPLGDALLARAYAASDVVAVPSRQEAFGKVAAEALACGAPVVAFADTGVADAVEHGRNGFLAQDDATLADGIGWVLEHPRPAELRRHARDFAVTRLSAERQVADYADLYADLVERRAA